MPERGGRLDVSLIVKVGDQRKDYDAGNYMGSVESCNEVIEREEWALIQTDTSVRLLPVLNAFYTDEDKPERHRCREHHTCTRFLEFCARRDG